MEGPDTEVIPSIEAIEERLLIEVGVCACSCIQLQNDRRKIILDMHLYKL